MAKGEMDNGDNDCFISFKQILNTFSESPLRNHNSAPHFHRSMSSWDDTDSRAVHVRPEMFEYPFENLIFEGGGNKGLAYCGAIQCLEDMNILPNIKRVGGSSAGAITATLVALGYTSKDIYAFMSDNVEEIFLDHSCGYLSLIPNLLRRWGWNPGHKIFKWFGDRIKARTVTNNPDLTFYELYKERGVELCVVVTNLNQMRSEYCHPKTTPDMPIREALRMSMSIPGVFMACMYDNYGQKDAYVDGGVLCNYPIHCFDGWFLSMDTDDSFLLKMQNLNDLPQKWSVKNTFGERNKKTVGFLLYDDTEVEIMRYSLERRINSVLPEKPSRQTKLYKQKQQEKEIQTKFEKEHTRCVKAAEAFMKALHKHNLQDQVVISKDELRNALEDVSSFSAEDKELLFGQDISVDDAFEILDRDGNGQGFLHSVKNVRGLKRQNIHLPQTRIQGYGRIEVNNLVQFISALQNTWTTNLKNIYVGDEDVHRTVGINTGHVGTSNYVLEEEDRTFLIERGYSATMAFLRYFVTMNPNLVKKNLNHKDITAEIDETEELEFTGKQHIENKKSKLVFPPAIA
ncbi:unnamed protein product [Candidula unifasciata]|uniref:PNPLA domain-containing protein n=1 Tax=Candidula unifasciata TaxID=100452 RepID=A0A8S3YVT9_9EUPU|nr:unnamed protein product [Candidula unifasciata]